MFSIQRRQDKLHLTPEPKVYTVYLLSEVCLDYIHLGQIVEVPWIGQLILQGQDKTYTQWGQILFKDSFQFLNNCSSDQPTNHGSSMRVFLVTRQLGQGQQPTFLPS